MCVALAQGLLAHLICPGLENKIWLDWFSVTVPHSLVCFTLTAAPAEARVLHYLISLAVARQHLARLVQPSQIMLHNRI